MGKYDKVKELIEDIITLREKGKEPEEIAISDGIRAKLYEFGKGIALGWGDFELFGYPVFVITELSGEKYRIFEKDEEE